MRAYGKENGAELSATYAAVRNALYEKGYVIEITVNFNPKLHYVAEWWKQLYGESEGKRRIRVYSPPALTSRQICTPWGNTYRKDVAICSRRFFPLIKRNTACKCLAMPMTLIN